MIKRILQCLGSGSVRSAKICGSTDPDSRGKISTKNCKKKTFLLLKPKSKVLKKEIIKISFLILNGFRIKISEKNKTKNLQINFCLKKLSKF